MRRPITTTLIFGLLLFSSIDTVSAAAKDKKAKKQLSQGQKFFDEGQFEAAAESFKRSYELNGNYEALYNLAQSQVRMERYQAAIDLLRTYLQEKRRQVSAGQREVVEKEISRIEVLMGDEPPEASAQPNAPPTKKITPAQRIQRGLAHQHHGRYELARSDFTRVFAKTSDFRTLYLLGKTEAELKRYQQARDHYHRYLTKGKDKVPGYRRIEVEQEIERLDALLKRSASQDEAFALFKEGRALFFAGSFKQAQRTFKKGYAVFPRPEFLYYLGKIAVRYNDDDAAFDAYSRYLKEVGNDIPDDQRSEVDAELKRLRGKLDSRAKEERAGGLAKQALEWTQAGEHERAIGLYKQALEIEPSAEILFQLGEAQFKAKQYDEARTSYDRYLSGGRGKISATQRKRVAQRLKQLDKLKATEAKRKRAQERYDKGLQLIEGQQYTQARVQLEEAYRIGGDYQAFAEIAKCEIELRRYSEALSAFERFLKLGKKDIPAQRRTEVEAELKWLEAAARGQQHYSQKKYTQAQKAFEKAYARKPTYALLYYTGKIAAKLGQAEDAMAAFKRYLKEGGKQIPQSARADVQYELDRLAPLVEESKRKLDSQQLFEDGLAWLDSGGFKKAEATFKKAYKLDARPEILYHWAHALEELQSYTKARMTYERYLRSGDVKKARRVEVNEHIERLSALEAEKADRKKSISQYNAGLKLLKQKQYQQAMDQFESAYKLHADYRVLRAVGKAARGLKRYGLAIDAYHRFLEEGGDKVSSKLRVKLEMEIEEMRSAQDTAEKKKEAMEHFKLANTLKRQRSFDKALAEYRTAYKIHPIPSVLYHMAKVEYMLKNYEQAIDNYTLYLEQGTAEISAAKRAEIEKEIERLRERGELYNKQEQASAFFKSGMRLKNKRQYDDALEALEKAYDLDNNYKTLLPIAECNAKLKYDKRALDSYKKFLSRGRGRISKQQRVRVQKEIDRLESRVNRN